MTSKFFLLINRTLKKQMAFQLARSKIQITDNDEEFEEYQEILNNSKIHENFMHYAKEMDELKPKDAEDIFKTSSESIHFIFKLF
jgi:26S proteasome regulatory subunit N1